MVEDIRAYQPSSEMRRMLEPSKIAFGVFERIDGEYVPILFSDGMCELFERSRDELVGCLKSKSFPMMQDDDADRLIRMARDFPNREEGIAVCRVMHSGEYHPILFRERLHVMPDGPELYLVECFDLDKVAQNGGDWFLKYLDEQKNQTFIDEVTGLPGITYYQRFATGTLRRLLDQGDKPQIILFDIQGMHFYNDRFGYEKGDLLLRETGKIIQSVFEGDFCVRYTEDHFVVITTRADIDWRIDLICERLHLYVDDAAVDINAGVYKYVDPSETCDSAVDKARRAVDFIHNSPDAHVRFYDRDVAQSYHKRNYVLSHYREAMNKGWIKVYYQPLINGLNGKVVHCEALARWMDPIFGLLGPNEFIGILEDRHRIWELDLFMLEQVCKDLAAWKAAGKVYPLMSVNLSRHDLAVSEIHSRINAILDTYGVGHNEIAIEITESALAASEQLVAQHIKRFHEDGYKVWLDDFGSGYSSFNALQNFDFDLLKIDMQFLKNQNQRTASILASIVDLTKQLGIHSVTEGVETEEQSDYLRGVGCEMLQGYLYSMPIPNDQLFDTLTKKGLEVEAMDDRGFYEALSRVNVINIDHPTDYGNYRPFGGEKSISIVIEDGGDIQIVYASQAGREWMQRIDYPTLGEISARASQVEMPIHKAMTECFNEVHQPGDIASRWVVDPSFEGDMQVELIACMEGRRGFVVSCMDARRPAK